MINTVSSTKPRSLEDIEALLAKSAKEYKASGVSKFDALMKISKELSDLRDTYQNTPKDLRPEPSWTLYAKKAAARCGLGFKGSRMADYYIKLAENVAKIGVPKVRTMVTDGTYREVLGIAEELMPGPKKKTKSVSARAHLARALNAIIKAEPGLPAAMLVESATAKEKLQSILAGLTDSKSEMTVEMPNIPNEWAQRLFKARASKDKAEYSAVCGDLSALLMKGDTEGFPPEVSF
jgi:hypothetical protein